MNHASRELKVLGRETDQKPEAIQSSLVYSDLMSPELSGIR